MKINNTLTAALLTTGILASGLAQPVAAADAPQTGSAKVKLQFIHGVLRNGSPDPAHNAACKKQLSAASSRFIGMPVTTQYSIDPKTLMMSAKSTFPSPNSLQPLELNVDLNPLGLSGNYTFGAFRPATLPDSYVFFSISKQLTNAQSSFLIINPNAQYNCMISSSRKPFESVESAKFGMD